MVGWWGGAGNCFVFGKDNVVRIVDEMDFPRSKTPLDHTPGKAERELSTRGWNQKDNPRDHDSDTYIFITTYAACGDYVYFVESGWGPARRGDRHGTWHDLFRVKTDGTDKKLLRKDTNIYNLMVVKDKLFCLAYLPNGSEEIGFYALDENGKVSKTIAHGFDGEWGWNVFERVGNLIMFNNYSVNGSEVSLHTLYNPATGAVFTIETE